MAPALLIVQSPDIAGGRLATSRFTITESGELVARVPNTGIAALNAPTARPLGFTTKLMVTCCGLDDTTDAVSQVVATGANTGAPSDTTPIVTVPEPLEIVTSFVMEAVVPTTVETVTGLANVNAPLGHGWDAVHASVPLDAVRVLESLEIFPV